MHKNLRIFRFFEKWELQDTFRHLCRNTNFLKTYYITWYMSRDGYIEEELHIISPVGLAKYLRFTVDSINSEFMT